jgi:hypothetical protein
MQLDNVTTKIIEDIALDENLTPKQVRDAIESFYKKIAELIRDGEYVHIRMPFLGTLYPNKNYPKFIEKSKEFTLKNERLKAYNARERDACVQSGVPDDKGI